jgi:hypothetical protein
MTNKIYTKNEIVNIFDIHNLKNNLINKISIITSNRINLGTIHFSKNLNLSYEFDSTYVALNYKLYDNYNKLIFEVLTESNKEMNIKNYLNNSFHTIENSAMNDITNVGLLFCESTNILFICINYVCLGYQNYVCELNMQSYIEIKNHDSAKICISEFFP